MTKLNKFTCTKPVVVEKVLRAANRADAALAFRAKTGELPARVDGVKVEGACVECGAVVFEDEDFWHPGGLGQLYCPKCDPAKDLLR